MWAYFVLSLYSVHGLIIQFLWHPVPVRVSLGFLRVDVAANASLLVRLLCSVIPKIERLKLIVGYYTQICAFAVEVILAG